MSELILRIFLSELKTFRLHCKRPNCGAITEVSLGRIPAALLEEFKCPCCRKPFGRDGTNYLDKLARSFEGLEACCEDLDAEFILHLKDKKAGERKDQPSA